MCMFCRWRSNYEWGNKYEPLDFGSSCIEMAHCSRCSKAGTESSWKEEAVECEIIDLWKYMVFPRVYLYSYL